MKKLLLTGIFLIGFALNTNAFNINDCLEYIKTQNLNSKNLLSYIKENNLTDKIMEVCSEDVCTKLNFSTLEQSVKYFIQRNIDILKNKDIESALEAELKGFKIDKIQINSCN